MCLCVSCLPAAGPTAGIFDFWVRKPVFGLAVRPIIGIQDRGDVRCHPHVVIPSEALLRHDQAGCHLQLTSGTACARFCISYSPAIAMRSSSLHIDNPL